MSKVGEQAKLAVRMISKAFLTASPSEKIGSIRQKYVEKVKDLEILDHVYIIDSDGKLVGTIPMQKLFSLPQRRRAGEALTKRPVAVKWDAHQEMVAVSALLHDVDEVPVVDDRGRLLGVVPESKVLKIMHEEHVEDFLKSAGYRGRYLLYEIERISPIKSTELRVAWLIVGLIGGIIAAIVVNFFEASIAQLFALAAFIPLIAYMAGAVCVQTQTLFVRLAAINPKFHTTGYLLREMATGFLLGIVIGILLYLYSSVALPGPVGIILLISLPFVTLGAAVVGFVVPYFLMKVGSDPAIGAGPFGTIVADVTGLIIYFIVAAHLLPLFPPATAIS